MSKNKTKAKKLKSKPKSPPSFWPNNWLPALILFGLSFFLYFQTFSFDYVLDDTIVITENNYVQQGWDGIGKIFSTESFTGFLGEQKNLIAGSRYRPLSLATFAIEYALYEFKPRNSHIINVLLYGLTALILFRLLSVFFKQKKSTKWYWTVPFLASLLFILHPLHTEVVANIKGRDEILALIFSLGTLFYSFRYIQKKRWVFLIISSLLFFLALLAKENSITFLAVIPLSIYIFSKNHLRSTVTSILPLLGIAFLYIWIRASATGSLFSSPDNSNLIMNNHFLGVGFWDKYATIMYSLGLYVKLLFFPHPLTHDYYPYHIPILGWLDWRVQLSTLINLALLVFAILGLKKKKVISWAILYYFITLSIVSNLLFFVGAIMNERFLYMPSVGFCVLLAYLSRVKLPLILSPKLKLIGPYILTGLILIAFGIKTISRIPAWENEMTLNRAAVKVSKNSARANQFMGYALYRQGLEVQDAQQQKALFDESTTYIDKALSIISYYQDAITTKAGLLAGYYQQNGDLNTLLQGFYNLLQYNHVSFIDEYLEYLNRRSPQQTMIEFYHKTGFELFTEKQKKYPLAEKYLNYGLQLDPNNLTLLEDKMILYYQMGNLQNARILVQTIAGLNPDSPRLKQYLPLIQGGN